MELIEAKELAVRLAAAGKAVWVRTEDALGYVLAETLTAHRSIPPQPRSRLDGFAVRSEDTLGASPQLHRLLEIEERILAAGYSNEALLIEPGRSVRILTGAPLPDGADSVVPGEEAQRQKGRLAISREFAPGEGVVPAGADVRSGELLLARGSLLTPMRLALIAALGHERIRVYTRPHVAILGTGDELRELGATPEGPSTFCNSRHLISWLTTLHGGKPASLGIAGDNPKAIAERLGNLDVDCVITTGGMGQGERDFIRKAWQMIGVRICFDRINISPGKGSALGIRGKQIFWGLSGNPWGAQVVFEELISPMLWRWQGLETARNPKVTAVLKGRLKKRKGIHKAFHGRLDLRTCPPSFTPAERDGSSVFSTLRDGFAYSLLEPHRTDAAPGEMVSVHFHDLPLTALALWDMERNG